MRCSLKEASEYIVPVAESDPASIERLRQMADRKFLSASTPGKYRHTSKVSAIPVPSTDRPMVLSQPGRSYGES
jgi:hypothetical protein